jgi:hypothetical protein
VAEDNLDAIGRSASAPGGQQVNADALLAELVRIVESSGFALKRLPPPVEVAPRPDSPAGEPTQAPEIKSHDLPPDAPSTDSKDAAVVVVQPPEPGESGISRSKGKNGIGLKPRRRSGAWTLVVSALVLAGAALIGSTHGLERMMSKPTQAPPAAAAAESPSPRSNPSVAAASSDPVATLSRDVSESKAASSEVRPVDLTARDSLIAKPAPSQDLAPSTAIGGAQPAAPPAAEPPGAPVTTPSAPPPAAAPQSPDGKDAATASVQPEPIPPAPPIPPATDEGAGTHASDAPLPPVRPTLKAAVPTGGFAQRSTAKLDSAAKPSSQSGAHAIAKAGAAGPGASEAKTPAKMAQAAVEPDAVSPAQAPPAPAPKQPNSNPVARAFGSVAGAVGMVTSLIPFVPH